MGDIQTTDWLTKGISKRKLIIEKKLSVIGARVKILIYPKLKRCPYCGTIEPFVLRQTYPQTKYKWSCECPMCDTVTDQYWFRFQAIRAWNKMKKEPIIHAEHLNDN